MEEEIIAAALNRVADALYEISHCITTRQVGEALAGLSQIGHIADAINDANGEA